MENKWDIKELDCSRMLINPRDAQLVNFFEKNIPSIKKINVDYKEKVFTRSMLYRYIILVYDPKSEIHKLHQLDWFAKKYQAAGYAGFKLSKDNTGRMKFDKAVDEMVFGKNKAIVDIIAEFLAWSRNQEWQYMVFLQESMLGFVRDALGRKINKHKSSQDYMKLYQDFRGASQEMAHVYDEPEEFVARFYYKLEESRMAVRPEDYERLLARGDDLRVDSPFGSKYIIDQLEFLGDDEEQVRERLS